MTGRRGRYNRAAMTADAPRTLGPGAPLVGEARVPGSKSLAQRALLAAALARGRSRLVGLPGSEDVRAALGAARALGAGVEEPAAGEALVTGRSPVDGPLAPAEPVRCGESATLARLVTAVLGLCGRPGAALRVEAAGSLLRRGSEPLLDALGGAGVRVTRLGAECWPLELVPARAPETVMLNGPVSSQELSGLLLALAALEAGPRGRSVLVLGGLPSEPYARMTAAVLERFGARFGAAGAEWRVAGPLEAPAEPVRIEPDASAAAVALAAGCLSGGEVCVAGFGEGSPQGDLAIVGALSELGCEASLEGGVLRARGFPTRAAELCCEDTPDLAPVLAALAGARALRAEPGAAPVRLSGLGTLNGKESRRVEVLAGGLEALGLAVLSDDDELSVGPGSAPRSGTPLVLDPRGDHRMAFAFALLSLVRPGLSVADPRCVAKSWPSFWEDLSALR
jgi:3-phosphoshikimate 1-carboxyvinyltransferase